MRTLKEIKRELKILRKKIKKLVKEKKRAIAFKKKHEADKRFCRYCKKKINPDTNRRKYCDNLCHSKYQYYLTKNNPELKEKKKRSYNKWRKKNLAYVSRLVLPKAKRCNKKRYWYRRQMKLCTRCGKKLKEDYYVKCPSCHDKSQKYEKKWKRKRDKR